MDLILSRNSSNQPPKYFLCSPYRKYFEVYKIEFRDKIKIIYISQGMIYIYNNLSVF